MKRGRGGWNGAGGDTHHFRLFRRPGPEKSDTHHSVRRGECAIPSYTFMIRCDGPDARCDGHGYVNVDARSLHEDDTSVHSNAASVATNARSLHEAGTCVHADAASVATDARSVHADATCVATDARSVHADATCVASFRIAQGAITSSIVDYSVFIRPVGSGSAGDETRKRIFWICRLLGLSGLCHTPMSSSA